MRLNTLLFFLAVLFTPNLLPHSNTVVVINNEIRAVCNLIRDVWKSVDYTPADDVFISVLGSDDYFMPADALLSALQNTNVMLQDFLTVSQDAHVQDFQEAIVQLIDQILVQLQQDQIAEQAPEIVSDQEFVIITDQPAATTDQKAPAQSEAQADQDDTRISSRERVDNLIVNKHLTVVGDTYLLKDLTLNGDFFVGDKKGMCFNTKNTCLGLGTHKPKATLDVRGNTKIKNNLSVGNDMTISSLGTGVVHAVNGALSTGPVVYGELDDNSVSTFALIDRCVTNDKLATQSVTADKLHNPLNGDINLTGNLVFSSSLNAVGAQAESSLKIVRGTIKANGDVLSGAGFTVEQTSTGVYAITFDNSFDDTDSYQLLVTPSVGVNRRINVTNTSSTVTTVAIFNDAATPTAQTFNFLAIGV